MKRHHIKNTALVVVATGLIFSLQAILSVQFNPNPTVWFQPDYYLQFIPVYISVTLLFCGIFVLFEYSRVNFYLAVFGHATSEEILFSLIGVTTSPLPSYAMVILFPASLVALWMAYRNTLKKRTVSVPEAVFGILFSTAFILLPRYL